MPVKRRKPNRKKKQRIVDNVFTFDNGTKARLNPIPALLLDKAAAQLEVPKVPIFVTDAGHEKENPTSPTYLADIDTFNSQRGSLMILTSIALGVQLVDGDGEDIDPPDNGWKETIAVFGADWRTPTPKGYAPLGEDVLLPEEMAEKCSYLMYVVMTTEDISALLEHLLGGEGYDEALRTFQSDPVGDAN